jgi:hypothetical protein
LCAICKFWALKQSGLNRTKTVDREIIRGRAEYSLQDNRRKDAIVKASDFNPIQKNQAQREQIRKGTNTTRVLVYTVLLLITRTENRLNFNKLTDTTTPILS